MWRYGLHPSHLISVATLPRESQNTENVILQWDITKENCIRCIIVSSRLSMVIICLKCTYQGVIQQCVYETKIHDIDDLRKRLMQTWFDFDQDITGAAIDQWRDHLRSCVRTLVVDTLNTCSFMWFTAVFYETVNVIGCIWQLFCSQHYNLKLCSHAFSVFQISQGSVASLIRWDGWSLYLHMCHSFRNLTVKTALKSVDFWRSYRQEISWLLFMAHSV